MRKIIIVLGLIAIGVFAQTALTPQPVDWRFNLSWDDPNVAGQVASWTVYASNNLAVRTAQTRILTTDLPTLLNGAPSGTYALFNVPTSVLGDIGEASTNLYVIWPGGSGKVHGGVNLRAFK